MPCAYTHTYILNYDEKATINLILEVIQLVILTHDPTSINIIEKKRRDKENVGYTMHPIVSNARTFPLC